MVQLKFSVSIKFRAFLITFGQWSFSDIITLNGEAAVLAGVISPLLNKIKYNDHGVIVSLTPMTAPNF